jgi:hypothetical protein
MMHLKNLLAVAALVAPTWTSADCVYTFGAPYWDADYGEAGGYFPMFIYPDGDRTILGSYSQYQEAEQNFEDPFPYPGVTLWCDSVDGLSLFIDQGHIQFHI